MSLALAMSFALPLGQPLGQDPAPGIDRALAVLRQQQIADVEYDLRFAIAPGATAVQGDLTLRFRLAADRDPGPVVLDFGGADLRDLVVNSREALPHRVHDHLVLPADLLVRGLNGVQVGFTSAVAPTGTPLTVYKDLADGAEHYYTLVVPADAHRLYPCFDQPDLRARFRVALDLPAGWTAVSNTPLDADGQQSNTTGKRWSFAQTKPLPTYLMAFACGPWLVLDGPTLQVPGIDAGTPLRVFLRAAEQKHLDLPAVAKLHAEGLRWIAHEFDTPYPFGKLDIVLVPGFPYGGMEHAGAIFYREAALAFDHPPTASELVGRSTLVYHELSHQWFGNLVTMKWFDDLWLKEGFATFVAYEALDALEPGQKSWLRFLQRTKPRAYEVDATPGTTPLWQELQNLADAKSAYGAIVYNKAPAVLRELHDRLGAANFRAGLHRYLEEHAFGNADWHDLALALEGAARANLKHWSERWLLAPSMPQVRIAWDVGGDGTTTGARLQQHAIGGEGTWPLHLELLVFAADGSTTKLALDSDAPEVAIPGLEGKPAPAAILANPGDVAYGQFVPDPKTRGWLCEHLGLVTDPLVRAVALSALFEAVREAELDPAAFAACALEALAQESDPDTHGWLLGQLGTCLERYLPADRAAPLRARAVDLLLRLLDDGEASGRELAAFRFLAWHSTDERVFALCRAVARGEARCAGLETGKRDRFLAAAALLAAGAEGPDFEALVQASAKEDVGKEVFLAKAARATAANKAEYWAAYMRLDEPPEQWSQDSLAFFHWPGQEALTLPYLKQALDRVDWVKQNRRIFFMPAWIDAFVNGHDSAEALAIVDEFLATAKLSDDVRRKVLQSRDGLLRAVRIRAAFAGGK
ncbi:MAG: M1 family aminopeptidase [Planctomycetota bacterium]